MASRDISECVEELQIKWPLLQDVFCKQFKGWGIEISCSHRPVEEQFELFKKGRREVNGEWIIDDSKSVVTYVDGKSRLSEHNYKPSRAIDVFLKKPDGSITWDLTEEPWKKLPEIVQGFGLESGGTWQKFKDYPHIQVSKAGWV